MSGTVKRAKHSRTATELIRALHYIDNELVVVKDGGAAMERPRLAKMFAQDVAALQKVRKPIVFVHGGGPAVTDMQQRLRLKTKTVDGQRVTDAHTMLVVQQVLIGLIATDIIAEIARCGGSAIGLIGAACGGWLRGRLRQHIRHSTSKVVHLGRVGDVAEVRIEALRAFLADGLVPVVPPVAFDELLRPLNVNADAVASAIAQALRAPKLIFLTNLEGIYGPDGAVVKRVDASTLRSWIESGVVNGGMIPKAQACLDALAGGVGRVTIADGRVPHALLVEVLTDRGVGTMVVPDDPA
ncbi:acetylglutamate kinase [Candidatus Uhrbacteria bacterium RIFCSPLOWO2_12_FULL_46_10]|uniref:Acetylglutamate kinase n=1 Tax=Candidatus Uhrbacteria bacterium RIFCSPLOWO2_01_FULL_47_25 TaxID=1802402 RepID=A0A1F7UT92_9BACT|nr:MAG: Acetylglutamate kinase [Parcubacteria group bacterium GW2011_GWA2_46_9]OGL60451.1 MAG: acetylglutamate kinase [Candidatus Uhrbacteria bacterium RIFCSPHIGHO2_01_FULL_46_23]OGL67860.1 MAG: acetylglutamate kinase [Candidatus Uhrbacteria bacterium RIFCSPHIGHO2_02_FULL_47_29]OGL81523.1 MAG: acetylglutamate kinase [Candidatus Uhrbacteria bacterium RIFCSPLOWO2_01_FULL_47_25]OGL85745.1 MAG: acetylglutamate kinase [Candidatus Uhrbacteria bacterium RIFCSPLOWO2_02_FULL_46_19]OGL90616.1 MAG: acety